MKRTVLRIEELEQRDVPSTLPVAPALLTPHSSGGVTMPAALNRIDLNVHAQGRLAEGVQDLGSPKAMASVNVSNLDIIPKAARFATAEGVQNLNSPTVNVNPSTLDSIIPKVRFFRAAEGFQDLGSPKATASVNVSNLDIIPKAARFATAEGVQNLNSSTVNVNVSNLDRVFIAAAGDPAHDAMTSDAIKVANLSAPAHGVSMPAAVTMPTLGAPAHQLMKLV